MTNNFRWITSDAGQRWLAEAENSGAGPRFLRRRLGAERTRLVLQQSELRRKARAKFSRAARMFFTPRLLEQATDETLSAYKASRFHTAAPRLDVCCGLGGDLLGLAGHAPVWGVDRDPVACLLARANAKACGREPVGLCAIDAADLQVGDDTLVHVDPDRRTGTKRSCQLPFLSPSMDLLQAIINQARGGAIKLAPATDLPLDFCPAAEREWIGFQGQCLQQVLWFGQLADVSGRRRATILQTDGSARSITEPSRALPKAIAGRVGRFLFEPHASVLAAGLAPALAFEHQLAFVARDVVYLTGEQPIDDPALSCFEIQELLPLDRKRLRGYLRTRGIGCLEVKKRSAPIDVERLRRQLRVPGEGRATLLVFTTPHGVRAAVAQRCRPFGT